MTADNNDRPQRSLSDLAAEEQARREATGAGSRSLEAMMANISAQVTRSAAERRSDDEAAKTTTTK